MNHIATFASDFDMGSAAFFWSDKKCFRISSVDALQSKRLAESFELSRAELKFSCVHTQLWIDVLLVVLPDAGAVLASPSK